MKMPSEWLGENNQVRFTDPHQQVTAPLVLWGCVGSLAGGQEPDFTLAESKVANTQTRWRLLWVTKTDVIYVDAMKKCVGWEAHDLHSQEGPIDDLVAWSRPRDSIMTVSLVSAAARRVRNTGEAEFSWEWQAKHRVTFQDGTELNVPLFERTREVEEEQALVDLVRSLVGEFRA